MSTKPRWVVVRAGEQRRWGGEIRRQEIFGRLAERTGAAVVDGWPAFRRAVLGGRLRRVANRFGMARPDPSRRLAASEQAPASWLDWLPGNVDPTVVTIYDDGVLQAKAIGVELSAGRIEELNLRRARNERLFRWLVVPTASFAEFVGLDMDKVIVGGNGTVASRVRPGPWPAAPSIGIASGAAPSRGIEALIEAARRLRGTVPDLRLHLWLAGTSAGGEAYIGELRTQTAGEPWIEIGRAPYEQLGETLAAATVLAIPSPATEYSDVALPVKLFDYMAAGRPQVVTPRREAADLVTRYRVGGVAGGDDPDSLAAAFAPFLTDEALAREVGARARETAERQFDWPIVGGRIADEILRREGPR
jgi:glycosyltransferase involved in cell wall biosynthesis